MSEEELSAIWYFQEILDNKYDTENWYIVENLIDRQQKELDKKDKVINKAIGHIEACKTALGNYVLSPSETEYLLKILKNKE